MKTIPVILLTLAIAVPLTWLASRQLAGTRNLTQGPGTKTPSEGRKLLYYQSAMHPWVKSDKPGRCTICGMELTPVYEGDAGFDASGGDVVPLTQTMIQVMNVGTEEVKIQPLIKTLSVAGTIDDNAQRHRVLSTYVPGRIQKLFVNYVGAEVEEGQILAEFYSPSLLQAEREYRTLTGDLKVATALRLVQMGLTEAQIANLAKKPADKLTSEIVAPMSGSVVSQNVYEGQYVQEGEKLFELADFSTMWFQFNAYEQDLPWIKLGQKVDVTTSSHPGKVYSGTVAFIDPNFDPTTRSTKVRVELPNPRQESGYRMLHRLYADGIVYLDAPEALAVPRSAIIETGPEAVAYVDQGAGAYGRRLVKLGRRGATHIEVLSGLEAGDKVVVNGNLLIDGQAEMNRAFSPAPADSTNVSTNVTPLMENQKEALTTLWKANDQIALALAQDDLAAFNAAGEGVTTATEALVAVLNNRKDLADVSKHLLDARNLGGFKDLKGARKAYHAFANASAKLLEQSRASFSAPFDIYECPMVDRAIPGVSKKGRWVQAAAREIGNPYFGAEMMDCGAKVSR